MDTDFRARAVREENGIRLSVSDNAISLLTFALMGNHLQSLDTLLASLASGVVADNLRPYLVQAMKSLDIPPTEELTEGMVKNEMDRLDSMVAHGAQRGPLLEVTRDETGVSVLAQPPEFYLLTLSAGSLIETFEGGSQNFLLQLSEAAGILTPAEKMSLLKETGKKPEGQVS